MIEIYTDGACKGNPGPGGWGAILVFNGIEKELSGNKELTTNNEMELSAVVYALEALTTNKHEIKITSDSKYVVDGFEKWLDNWAKKNWRTSTGAVKNLELWKKMYEFKKTHKITMHWVKGHNGHSYNEKCDVLATSSIGVI